jgi:glucose dehydrogenase
MRCIMTSRSGIAVVTTLLLSAGADATDMSFERALKVDQEPQNWLLHHQNYQGHRFSGLKEINTDTVANLSPLHQLDAIFTIFGASDRDKRLILQGRGLRKRL